MSDIVSGILKHTFGFLANKIRKEVAQRLKDSDVTSEECRRLIVRELDDIKGKLDGLARKDLLSSLCFLQEGINGLYQSLLQFPSDEKKEESTERVTLVEASSSRVASPNSPSSISEAAALINAIASLKIHSDEHFKSTVESFKLAREKATEAFCNEALSIEDRIQASQIRMMARILEKLEHPDAGVSDCLQYLQQLHDIGAIREIFSVLIDGGIKSRFNRTKRFNNASTVQEINVILFNFARKFTKLLLDDYDWPTISIANDIYNLVSGIERLALVNKLERSGVQLTSRCPDFTFDNEIFPKRSVVNSKGEIVANILRKNTIKIFKRSGENRIVCKVPMERQASEWYVAAMDIDAEDNIYVITAFRESDGQSWSFQLFIFGGNGNRKLESQLSFHQRGRYPRVRIAIHKDGRIAIFNCNEKMLYIGNICGEMNSYKVNKNFRLEELSTPVWVQLLFSDVNGIKIIGSVASAVYIYTENGQLQRVIKIPDGDGYVSSLAMDYNTAKAILVKTHDYLLQKDTLLSFSETGELVYRLPLESGKWDENAIITSHPNGAVVLVDKTEAMLIKGQQKQNLRLPRLATA